MPNFRSVAQFGGALGLGPRGCGFKSCHSDYRLKYSKCLIQIVQMYFSMIKTKVRRLSGILYSWQKRGISTRQNRYIALSLVYMQN